MRPAYLAPICFSLAAGLALSACSGAAGDEPSAAAFDEAEVLAKTDVVARSFTAALQAKLGAAMAEGGPMLAVGVCKDEAPAIAVAASAQSGAQVSRVSDRNRNPDGGLTPELAPHYAALASAERVAGTPTSEVWQSGEGADARINVLRAIPMMEKPCAACHGTNVDPTLAEHIGALYPEDAAMGFEAGEMRGALLVSWPVGGVVDPTEG